MSWAWPAPWPRASKVRPSDATWSTRGTVCGRASHLTASSSSAPHSWRACGSPWTGALVRVIWRDLAPP
eukprot:6125569-Alexandrium_andersonii.AAC.1